MDEPGTELAVIVAQFPDHRTLGRALQDGVNTTMLRMRDERGAIHCPEDMYGTVRWMQDTAEKMGDYALAFAGAGRLIGQYVEETLIDAVGEQDGIPAGNLTVPAADGDINLAVQQPNDYTIDVTALHSAVAFEVIQSVDLTDMTDAEQDTLAGLLIAAQERIAELGKYEAQVSKVRAYAKTLARQGHDSIAATVNAAIRHTRQYRGVKMARKAA